ncbi:MAG: hypothetical protein ABIH00_11065 [Armatimonadota bacterium]
MEDYEKDDEMNVELNSCGNDSFSIEGMIGAAILGAVGSMVIYYVYCNLNDETKLVIKENLTKFAKKQLVNLK